MATSKLFTIYDGKKRPDDGQKRTTASELLTMYDVSPTAVKHEHIAVNLYDPYLDNLFTWTDPNEDGLRVIINPYQRPIVVESIDAETGELRYEYGDKGCCIAEDEEGFRFLC